jgi:uroporphyrinogen decarboxylase
MQKPREIVRRTVDYAGPERVAGSMPPPYWYDFYDDSYTLKGYAQRWRDIGDGRQEYVDEWGNTWARLDAYSKGEVVRGAIENIDDVYSVPLPDLANLANFAGLFSDVDNEKFRLGHLPGFPFNIARKMRRLDQFLVDLLLEQEKICALLKRIEDLLAETIVQYGRFGADGVMFPEDWGMQNGMMINPQLWRKVFKPGFDRLCNVAHTHGLKVFMHSCGKITEIIPDLIEVGIDVLQFDQPQLHGVDNLARFHGRITFWCPVDIQVTLPKKDTKLIQAEAREMIQKLGGPEGGFIAGYYPSPAAIGLEAEWQEAACQAFTRFGDYRSSSSPGQRSQS